MDPKRIIAKMYRARAGRFLNAVRAAIADRAGAASIEFAFACVVLLVVLTGVVESSRAIWTSNSLQFATEQAGRYIIANPGADDAAIRAYVILQIAAVETQGVSVTVTRDTAGGVEFVSVVASYHFTPIALAKLATMTLTGRSRIPLVG